MRRGAAVTPLQLLSLRVEPLALFSVAHFAVGRRYPHRQGVGPRDDGQLNVESGECNLYRVQLQAERGSERKRR